MSANCCKCNDTGDIPLFSSMIPCDCRKGQAMARQRDLHQLMKTPEGRREIAAQMTQPIRRGCARTAEPPKETATQVMAAAFAQPHDFAVEDIREQLHKAFQKKIDEGPPLRNDPQGRAAVSKMAATWVRDSIFGQSTVAEICAAQPMTPEGLFQSGLKDVSSERGRQHLEQYKSFADQHEATAVQCSSEIDRLALWFTTNASEEIVEGSAVDNAIAYMERLRKKFPQELSDEVSFSED